MGVRKQTLIPFYIDHFDPELYDVPRDITGKLELADQVKGSKYMFNVGITPSSTFASVTTPVLKKISTYILSKTHLSFVLLQVFRGHRRTVKSRVRHGLYFLLAAETDALKVHPAPEDLF